MIGSNMDRREDFTPDEGTKDGQMFGLGPGTSSFWTLKATGLAIGSLAAFLVLAAAAWVLSATIVPWDSKNHFYPMFRFLGDALRHGEIPFWNPYIFAGHPAIADPQSLIFTPTLALLAFVAPDASMQQFDLAILAHLGFGGFCFLGLARRWGWHPAAAVLAAMIFMLGGAASSRLQHTGMIISYSFFPAALWCLEIALERRSYRFAILFGVMGALMALGRDQVAFLLCSVLIGRLLFAAIRADGFFAYLWSRAGVLAVGGSIAIALLLVPAALTLQFLAESNRPGIAFGMAAAGSLAPVNLITLIAPNFFGSLDWIYDYWGPDYETMAQADFTDRAINYLFVGTLPILLVFWHGLGAGRALERRMRFFAILLGLGLIYALGRNTSLFGLAFDLFPGVSLYRRPADASFIVNIALAATAGYLLHRYIEEGPPPIVAPGWSGRILPLATLAAVGAVIAAGLGFSYREHHLGTSLVELAIGAALAASGTVLLMKLARGRTRILAAWLLIAVTGAELLWRNAASALNAEPAERYDIFSHMPAAAAAGLETLRHAIAADSRSGERPRVEILGLSGPWQNASMVLKIEDTLGYNPLRLNDYERAVGASQNSGDPNLRHYPGMFRGYHARLASLLGLEYLVLDRPLARLPRHIPRPRGTAIYSSDNMYIYKIGEAMPRAYFASRVKPVDIKDVLATQTLPDADLATEVLIHRPSQLSFQGENGFVRQDEPPTGFIHNAATAKKSARLEIIHYGMNHVAIDVESDRAGIVVLHDLYYPGWQVRVDGGRKPLLHANILFRGVEVMPGRHRVEFSFHPLSFENLAAAFSNVLHRKEN